MNELLPWEKDEEFEQLVLKAKSAPIQQKSGKGSFGLNCTWFLLTLLFHVYGIMVMPVTLMASAVVGFFLVLRKNERTSQVGVSILVASQCALFIALCAIFYLFH
jgi:acyl-CoA synthetase (AMP-forming)/AMP-acid ligase II